MTAFRIGTRTWSILGLSLALGGCARQPPSAPDGTKVAREEKPLVGVVEVTPEEAPQNLTAALGKARASCGEYQRLLDQGVAVNRANRLSRDSDVSQALTSVKAGLAELPVTAGNKVPPWVKVHLNTAGAKFDAVRFTNQYGFPGDLVLALVFPVETNMSWLIVPEGGHAWEDFGFVDFHQKHDLVIPELDLPAQNAAIFLQLEGAKITQAREFLLAFAFPDATPIDIYIKLTLTDPRLDKCSHFTTAHPVAERLGIELPFRFSQAAPLTERATDVAERHGPEAGLEFLEQELARTSDRGGEFAPVRLLLARAQELIKKREPRDKANACLLKAAATIRPLRDKYRSLSAEEARLLLMALYNEACALSLSGKPEQALNSLQEAFRAGYTDVAEMRGDDDLEAVRQLPAFDEWLKQLEKSP